MESGLKGKPCRTVNSAVNWSGISDSIISCSSRTGPPLDPPGALVGAGELTLCRMLSMTPLIETNFFIFMLDMSWLNLTHSLINFFQLLHFAEYRSVLKPRPSFLPIGCKMHFCCCSKFLPVMLFARCGRIFFYPWLKDIAGSPGEAWSLTRDGILSFILSFFEKT